MFFSTEDLTECTVMWHDRHLQFGKSRESIALMEPFDVNDANSGSDAQESVAGIHGLSAVAESRFRNRNAPNLHLL